MLLTVLKNSYIQIPRLTNLFGDDMQIWRIEYTDGVGPYHSYRKVGEEFIKLIKKFDAGDDIHPMPHGSDKWSIVEKIGCKHDEIFYGFISIAQLRRWWFCPKLNACMAKTGFKIIVYHCDDSYGRWDEHQAMFVKRFANRISEHRIEEFLEVSESLAMAA